MQRGARCVPAVGGSLGPDTAYLPEPPCGPGKPSFSPRLGDWSPTCMSKIVGPQAMAEPRPPWCVPRRARGPGPGRRPPRLCWHPGMAAGPGFSMPPQSSPRKQPPLCRGSRRWALIRDGRLAPRPRRGGARAAVHAAPPCVLLLGSRLVKKIVSMYCIFCTCLHL